jgi:hypothetical protein
MDDVTIAPASQKINDSRFVCAIDSTKLLSANSFIRPSGYQDPEASSDFRFVVNHYCNDIGLFYVAPQTARKQDHATELLALWQDTIVKERRGTQTNAADTAGGLEDLPFDPEAEDINFADLAPVFSDWSSTNVYRLRAWLEFQFNTDPLMDIFWEGKNQLPQLEKALYYILLHTPPTHPLRVILNAPNEIKIDERFKPSTFLTREADHVLLSYVFLHLRKVVYTSSEHLSAQCTSIIGLEKPVGSIHNVESQP